MELDSLIEEYNSYLNRGILNFEKFNQYAIIHHSNAIEGSTLTLAETYLLLDEKLTPKNKPLEHSLMAVDHLEALKFICDKAKSKTNIGREDIQKIGELVKKNTGSIIKSMGGDFDERKGEFRKNTVYAGNRTFANYQKVPGLIDDLVDYINENIKLVKTPSEINKLSYEAHYQMITIHPFSDGNGRSSRLLMNYIQHYHGLPLTRVFSEDKSEYILALEMTRKKEDIKHFLSFMDFQTKKNLSLEIEKFKQGEKEIKQRNNKGKGFSFLF